VPHDNQVMLTRSPSYTGPRLWYHHPVTLEHVMSAKRAAGYCGGALLLLAWLSSADGVMRQAPDVSEAVRPVETAGTTTLAADVQAQTLRLKTRLAAAPVPQEPFRNPFTFASRPSREKRELPPRVEADAPTPPAGRSLEPAIELIGVAQTESQKGVVRTAIISALSGELFLVKEGETIVARYRVGTVAVDAVELTDLVSGTVRRLALRE
jgi:hypothetical protein